MASDSGGGRRAQRRVQSVVNSAEVRGLVAEGYEDWRRLVRAAVAAYERKVVGPTSVQWLVLFDAGGAVVWAGDEDEATGLAKDYMAVWDMGDHITTVRAALPGASRVTYGHWNAASVPAVEGDERPGPVRECRACMNTRVCSGCHEAGITQDGPLMGEVS